MTDAPIAPPPPGAVVDIGTNTVLLLVGRRGPGGNVDVIDDHPVISRLGEGLPRTGRLSEAAVARTLAALAYQRRRAERFGVAPDRFRAVATAGVRMAQNAGAFLTRATEVLGTQVTVLSGAEEARLSYRSVADVEPGGPLRVLDIGGGSTEVVTGEGADVASAVSLSLGSVHLWEARDPGDPPGQAAYDEMRTTAGRVLAAAPTAPRLPRLVAVAGTATTTAALLLDLSAYDRRAVDGAAFPREAVTELGRRLAAMPHRKRAAHPCLPPGRADVIVAGVAILDAALAAFGADTLVVRDRGHRFALLP